MNQSYGLLRLSAWAWRYGRRHLPELIALGLLTGLTVLLGVLRPWPMVFLIDHVLKNEPTQGWLAAAVAWLPGAKDQVVLAGFSVAATVLIFVVGWAIGLGSTYFAVTLTQRMTYDLAGDLFRHLQQLSLRFHATQSVGDSILRITSDSGCAAQILREALLPAVSSLASLLLMFTIMWQISVPLTLVSLAVVPFMGLIVSLYARPMLERSYCEQEMGARMYEVVERTFSSIPAVQAFGREPLNDDLFQRIANGNLTAAVSVLSAQLQFKILIGLVTAIATAALLWLGAREVMAGAMTLGTIVLFLSYLASLYAPIEAVMYTGSTISSVSGSAKRVLEIMGTERDVADRRSAVPLAHTRGRVRFENVGFGYDRERPILHDISLEVKSGETVALVGPTGAGKSTLVSLIPRFFDPTQGRVLIDGLDLREVRLADLRRQVALVLQEPFLFPLSIAENISYGRPGASRSKIEAAARAASAHDFISRLPQGYDTILAERGASLSGGERQRLSIARALLTDAPILILDEPTSALDAGTEALILAAMRNLIQGRTTFIIAHRLATVRHADRIVVLKDGQIVESGTHDELVRRNGLYAHYTRLHLMPADPVCLGESILDLHSRWHA